MGSVVHISSHKIMSASSSPSSSKSNCWQHFRFQVALTLLFSIVSFLRYMSTMLTLIFYRPFQIHIRTAPKCIGCTLYVISQYWALGLVSYFKSLASYGLLFPPRPNWGWFRLIYRFLFFQCCSSGRKSRHQFTLWSTWRLSTHMPVEFLTAYC